MRKRIAIFIIFLGIHGTTLATTRDAQLTNTTGYNYNYMYPYLSNQMRTDLNPGVTTSQSTSPINVIVRTTKMPGKRRVVPRPTAARSATNTTARRTATMGTTTQHQTTSSARSAAPAPVRAQNTNRRVVARSGLSQSARIRNATRGDASYTARTTANTANYAESSTARISSARCLTDYTQCMNGYCERKDTAYNKCYCSSKLSQIDSQYQDTIDSLIKQILTLRGTNQWTESEMNEYWMQTVGQYSGTENSWKNLENALNIDWAGMESRVRGQSAFNTGHEYCVQHLRGCSYMAANLRDAYRSEIARDCATYEQSLQLLKNAAESIIEANK